MSLLLVEQPGAVAVGYFCGYRRPRVASMGPTRAAVPQPAERTDPALRLDDRRVDLEDEPWPARGTYKVVRDLTLVCVRSPEWSPRVCANFAAHFPGLRRFPVMPMCLLPRAECPITIFR